jgi:hypothetical protein
MRAVSEFDIYTISTATEDSDIAFSSEPNQSSMGEGDRGSGDCVSFRR